VIETVQASDTATTTTVKPTIKSMVVAKPVPVRPTIVVPPAVFSVRPLSRRNMDLLDSLPTPL
jgi:hypothetical protein